MSRSWERGSTRRWRQVRASILARDGYRCQIPRADGLLCGAHATHVDHIVPLADGGPEWDPANLRAACAPCNLSRGTRARAAGPTAAVTVVVGPPGGGKSTWVADHAVHGDIAIDLDLIATALTPGALSFVDEHTYPQHVRHVAIGARAAAIRRAVALPASSGVRVWIVQAVPSVEQLRQYRADGWAVQVCDPGPEVVRGRTAGSDRQLRHFAAIDRWYSRRDQLLAVLGQDQIEPWEW